MLNQSVLVGSLTSDLEVEKQKQENIFPCISK